MKLLAALLVLLPCLACASDAPHASAAPAPAPAAPEPPTPLQRFAPWQGTRVHYLDAGTGDEALVLVHGWAGSTVTWKHQFPDLAGRARTLAIDLPGHGKSDPPPAGYSFAAFADALAAVLDDAGVAGAVIVGHSNGTPVALAFHRRYRERTLGLVGIDGALKAVFTAEEAAPMLAPFRDERWQLAMSSLIDSMIGPGLAPEDREAIRSMALATRHEAVMGGFDAALAPDAYAEGAIDVPLLLVLARQPTWTAEYESWVRQHAPRVDYRMWSDVGHFPHMERPIELRAALEEFLTANGLL